jgi:hypothetical protein
VGYVSRQGRQEIAGPPMIKPPRAWEACLTPDRVSPLAGSRRFLPPLLATPAESHPFLPEQWSHRRRGFRSPATLLTAATPPALHRGVSRRREGAKGHAD